MKRLRIPRFFFFLGLLLTSACTLIDPAEPTPAYLYLAPATLRTTPSQGSASANITEGWLDVGDQFLGAYSLPNRAPVLGEGPQGIRVQAGIRDNGISSTPEIYPFYAIYQTERTLTPGKVDTIRPVVTYTDRTQFAFIDDFERGAPVFQTLRIGSPDNRLRIVEEGVFEGTGSGRIRLDPDNPVVELATDRRFRNLTANSPYVYLELNYRSDVPVVFGIIGYRDGVGSPGVARFDPGFRPRDTWNKIYFNLSPLLADRVFDEVQIALQAALPQQNGVYTLPEAYIWLDNIKLVHF